MFPQISFKNLIDLVSYDPKYSGSVLNVLEALE